MMLRAAGRSGVGRARIATDDRERIVRIRIALVERNRPRRCVHSFAAVCDWIIAPAVSDDAGTDTAKPAVRLRQVRIGRAGTAKQFASRMMSFARHFMEMPHALPHEVPRGHVAGVAGDSKSGFGPEKLGFDRRDDALGDLSGLSAAG